MFLKLHGQAVVGRVTHHRAMGQVERKHARIRSVTVRYQSLTTKMTITFNYHSSLANITFNNYFKNA
jgi:hypothetical protein